MPDLTPRVQIPIPLGTEDNDVVGSIRSVADRLDLIPGVQAFTTTARDSLAAAQKWAGRVIWNTTSARLEGWNGTTWEPVTPRTIKHRSVHTWAVGGPILVPSGTNDVLSHMYVDPLPGETLQLVSLRYVLGGGTSAGLDMYRNGVGIPGASGLVVDTNHKVTNITPLTFVAGDRLAPVIFAISNSPINMTLTAVFEHTAAIGW